MAQVVADGLLLEGNTTEVSQAVAMDGFNGVRIHVWLLGATGTNSSGITVYCEGSEDLENWSSINNAWTGQINEDAPGNFFFPTTMSLLEDFSFPFARLKYVNGNSADFLLGASIIPYNKAS